MQATRFDYGPDGARAGKSFINQQRFYLGADAEVLVDGVNTSGLLTSYLHPDVRREGQAVDILVKDHLASNRLVLRVGSGVTRANYGPYGQPLTSNGSVALQSQDRARPFTPAPLGKVGNDQCIDREISMLNESGGGR